MFLIAHVALLLASLAFSGHGRRLHTSGEPLPGNKFAEGKKWLKASRPAAAFNPSSLGWHSQADRRRCVGCNGPRVARTAARSVSATPCGILRFHSVVSQFGKFRTSSSPLLSASTKRRASGEDWKKLLRLAAPDWPLLLGAFFMLSLAAAGEALQPKLAATALNIALGQADDASIGFRGALVQMFVIGAATAAFTGIRGFLFWISGNRVAKRLRSELFAALIRQPQAFHDEQGPGKLTSRLASDCERVENVISLNVNVMLRQIMQCLIGFCIVLRINAQLAGLIFTGILLRTIWTFFYSKARRRLAKAFQDALTASTGVAEQCISLIKVVRSHGNEDHEKSRYGKKLKQMLTLQIRESNWITGDKIINAGLDTTILASVIGLGSVFLATGLLAQKDLTSFVFYATYLSQVSGQVVDQWADLQRALGAASTVFDYLVLRPLDSPNITRSTGTAAATSPERAKPAEATGVEADVDDSRTQRGAIVFDEVDFSYPSRPASQVFEKLSLSVKAGERVAILGGSGSGKSTIFSLAMHFYQPNHGRVTLDGVPLEHIDETTLRSSIAWVQQEPPLFSGATIRENIAYGLSNASHEEIEAAAREANAYSFIQRLPKGFDTRIGAEGGYLSGGQKQRIALARALVRDPAVLLLDEATSALDPKSARLVQAAIQRASARRTVLFTTHKVAQARDADRIIVMSRGRIVEDGTHEELLECNGAYAGLLQYGDRATEQEAAAVLDSADTECPIVKY